jgi:hypothetical protein
MAEANLFEPPPRDSKEYDLTTMIEDAIQQKEKNYLPVDFFKPNNDEVQSSHDSDNHTSLTTEAHTEENNAASSSYIQMPTLVDLRNKTLLIKRLPVSFQNTDKQQEFTLTIQRLLQMGKKAFDVNFNEMRNCVFITFYSDDNYHCAHKVLYTNLRGIFERRL